MLEISLGRLALMLLPLIAVGWISWRWLSKTKEIAIATGRMVVQLLAIGYVLVILFGIQNPWMALAVVAFMIGLSSWIAVRTIDRDRGAAYADALIATAVGGGINLVLVIFGVLALEPWFELTYIIPLAGMIFSNAMTAVTLSAERFDAERSSQHGVIESRNTAFNAALIPQVNSFLAVGLVSLPGMMTGQILAGASPLDAVRYQIMVMAMILGSAGLAVAIFLSRRVKRESERSEHAH